MTANPHKAVCCNSTIDIYCDVPQISYDVPRYGVMNWASWDLSLVENDSDLHDLELYERRY